jgi:ribosome-associated protein
MEDMLSETDAQKIAELLTEHKGQEVCTLDLRGINNWTDFFIIATVTSNAHMDGLERHIKEYCHTRDIPVMGKSKRGETGDEWRLIDLGLIIVHLMRPNAREFYELERLWSPIPRSSTEN